MGHTTSAISNVRSTGELKGSARSALICALFGSVWMYWAVVFSGKPSPMWFSIVTVPAVLLVASGIVRARGARHLPSSVAEVEHWMAFGKFFWIDSGIEWGLSGVAVFVLARIDRFDLIPQALGVIIGLHFFPLVKIFRAPRYYWTGGIMVVAALGSLLIHRGYIRNIAGCAAIGLTLWVTSIAILLWTSSAVGGQTNSNKPNTS